MTGILGAVAAARTVPGLAVTISPTDVSGYGNTGAAANITTASAAAAATGGVPAYTYAWAQIGTTPYTWVIGSPAATTNFTCNTLGPGTTTEATFEVTVTDVAGVKAKAQVTAFANNGQPYDDRFSRNDRNFF